MLNSEEKITLSDVNALILVGGLGTRLRSLVSDVPKPMAPIEGKPFLYYIISQIKNAGIKQVVFCSGYLHSIIEDYFGNGSDFGINISYSIEKEQLGTAGAIKNAQKYIDSPFIMMNGDSYIDVDLNALWYFYITRKADYLMLLSNYLSGMSGGAVMLDSAQKITNFLEKPSQNQMDSLGSLYINAGVYILSPKILDLIPGNKKCSLEKEILPNLIDGSNKFYGNLNQGCLIDIGVPEGYKKFINKVRQNNLKF